MNPSLRIFFFFIFYLETDPGVEGRQDSNVFGDSLLEELDSLDEVVDGCLDLGLGDVG